MDRAILCILQTPHQAEQVIAELRAAGFTGDDLSGLLVGGAMTSDAAGGVFGESLQWLAGIGSQEIPGVGLLLAAEPIVAAISGAAVGAAVGGLTGALLGMGVSESEANQCKEKLEGGGFLITVHTDHPHQRQVAIEILEKARGENIHTTGVDSA